MQAAVQRGKLTKAWRRFSQWREGLPPSQQEVVCRPTEDSVHTRQYKAMTCTHWSCSICGKSYPLSKFRKSPCKRRPMGVTFQMALSRIVGEAKAAHFVGESAKRVKQHWKKSARLPGYYQRYNQRYGRKQYDRKVRIIKERNEAQVTAALESGGPVVPVRALRRPAAAPAS